MKLHELLEASGYIPKNEKEANDPRWQMAITNDIKPGENQRQATRLGFKVDANGNPPKLKSNGKLDETMMDVANQGRMPVSAGARGLMHARSDYAKVLDKEQISYIQGAIDALAASVKEGTNPSDAIINVSQYFKIEEQKLASAFKKHYNMTIVEYYKKELHNKKHNPKAV